MSGPSGPGLQPPEGDGLASPYRAGRGALAPDAGDGPEVAADRLDPVGALARRGPPSGFRQAGDILVLRGSAAASCESRQRPLGPRLAGGALADAPRNTRCIAPRVDVHNPKMRSSTATHLEAVNPATCSGPRGLAVDTSVDHTAVELSAPARPSGSRSPSPDGRQPPGPRGRTRRLGRGVLAAGALGRGMAPGGLPAATGPPAPPRRTRARSRSRAGPSQAPSSKSSRDVKRRGGCFSVDRALTRPLPLLSPNPMTSSPRDRAVLGLLRPLRRGQGVGRFDQLPRNPRWLVEPNIRSRHGSVGSCISRARFEGVDALFLARDETTSVNRSPRYLSCLRFFTSSARTASTAGADRAWFLLVAVEPVG